jgi:DNA/RNA endonuclease YhcR with UshA esterase domain
MATPLEVIASELLKSAIDAEKLFGKTKDQSYKDKAVRLRRIVVNLQELTIGTSSVATLNDLTDVTISAAANGQVLTYNSTTSQWENQTPAAGGGGDMLKCFHPDTELLTLNGWKKITDISFDDEVATLNQETKELEYQVPNHIFKYEYDGELLGRETKQLSYLVTPNHRMYVRKWYGGQRGLVWSENFYWERADEVSEKIRSFPITAKWNGVKTETNPFGIDDDLFLEFLGWFLAEGCVVDTKIYVTQTKSKTIADCTRVMVEMARSLERTLRHHQNAHFNFRHSELAKFLSQFGKHAHNKFIPSFIKNLPSEKLILFYSAYYKGDGHLNGNNITTVSKRMADDLQEIILKLGGYATITRCSPAVTSYGVRDIYRLNCNFNNLQGSTAKKDNYKIDYKGFVHCVEVDNATLYTRFNGKPVFLGNSTYDTDNSGIVDKAEALMTLGRNSTGATLYKGTVIRIQGSTGHLPNFVKAQGNNDANSAQTFGVISTDIANNSNGYAIVQGTIDTLDTRSVATHPFTDVTLADGDILYLHPTIAGYLTNVKPSAPQHMVYVGVVTRTSPTNGTIVYRIQNGYELDEIHDVAIASKTNNDLLVYESSTDLWKNKSISTIFGGTPLITVPTLAQVTTAGNTTTNAITVGGLTSTLANANVTHVGANAKGFYIRNNADSLIRAGLQFDGSTAYVDLLGRYQNGAAFIRQDGGNGNISFLRDGSEYLRIFGATGNTAINTTTDAGYKLDVNGSTIIRQALDLGSTGNSGTINLRRAGDGNITSQIFQTNDVLRINNYQGSGIEFLVDNVNYFHIRGFANQYAARVMGTLTAVSGLSTALLINNQINASANNDVLVGLDINPTFTNGAFTGVTNWGLRVQGMVSAYSGVTTYNNSAANTYAPLISNVARSDSSPNYTFYGYTALGIGFTNTDIALGFYNGGLKMKLFTTGNLSIGTPTDAGYKLDVNGTIRSSGTNGLILYDGTYGAKVSMSSYIFTIEKEGSYGVSTYQFKYNDNSNALYLSGLTSIIGLGGGDDGVMMSRNVYARADAAFGFTSYGATTKYKAIQALYTDNNTSGVAFNFKTGGTDTEAMRINSAGNVLVGTTTNAGYKLDVNGSARVGSLGLYGNNGTITAPLIKFNGSNQVNVDPQGYGIVTNHTLTTGNYIFASGGGIRSNGSFGAKSSTSVVSTPFISYGISRPDNDASVNALAGMGGVHDGTFWFQGLGLVFYTSNGSDISGGSYLTEKMRLSSVGNLGLGTNNPIYPLHISSAAAANIYGTVQSTSASGTAAWVAFNDQSDNVVYRVFGSGASGTQMGIALARSASLMANLGGSGKFLLGTYSNTDFVMGTGNAEKMRIVDSTGNILIATTTDLGNKLEVNGNINSTGYSLNNTAGYTGTLVIVTNPPGQQNIDIRGGIIVNVF